MMISERADRKRLLVRAEKDDARVKIPFDPNIIKS